GAEHRATGAGRGERSGDELVLRVGRDQRSEHRDQHQDPDEHETDLRAPEPEGTPEQVRTAPRHDRDLHPLGLQSDRRVAAQLDVAVAHSRVLSRGVTRIVATSASRLSSTYRPAIRIASACTTGMSWFCTASTSSLPMPG